ncbi:MAG: hypothetical protein DRI97_13045 [Bacteroidetes bacterium]|nr:MAG: hypothetical protein DRI83_12140 [Bacteroidota bacterium]RLD53654.1 MAG: hypothetical protein DRI97_13045 [Bacteroidota bacterium]RLD79615.1 MAG: hypothetical protein DRJ15_08985 [Bacteroidota bacterium]
MKINWGTGILIFIILFLIAIISFVIFANTQKVKLVEEDYYPKELNFDSQMEKQANAEALTEKVSIGLSADSLIFIRFPEFFDQKQVKGSILIYRPSDDKEDIYYEIALDSNSSQILPAGELLPGKYIIKLDWTAAGVKYFQEQVIIN